MAILILFSVYILLQVIEIIIVFRVIRRIRRLQKAKAPQEDIYNAWYMSLRSRRILYAELIARAAVIITLIILGMVLLSYPFWTALIAFGVAPILWHGLGLASTTLAFVCIGQTRRIDRLRESGTPLVSENANKESISKSRYLKVCGIIMGLMSLFLGIAYNLADENGKGILLWVILAFMFVIVPMSAVVITIVSRKKSIDNQNDIQAENSSMEGLSAEPTPNESESPCTEED